MKLFKVLWLLPLLLMAGCARQADDTPTTAPDPATVPTSTPGRLP